MQHTFFFTLCKNNSRKPIHFLINSSSSSTAIHLKHLERLKSTTKTKNIKKKKYSALFVKHFYFCVRKKEKIREKIKTKFNRRELKKKYNKTEMKNIFYDFVKIF